LTLLQLDVTCWLPCKSKMQEDEVTNASSFGLVYNLKNLPVTHWSYFALFSVY